MVYKFTVERELIYSPILDLVIIGWFSETIPTSPDIKVRLAICAILITKQDFKLNTSGFEAKQFQFINGRWMRARRRPPRRPRRCEFV
ncbi:hypothetical protein EVAR_62937_1 [Eumeta japonica]|uniref:Uncharacterized protein n=1 Tax=Eumeta variegata TaxID=151549 RepID=A0A4C1ZGU9_EUMVA|nr:hypothetical protein EVAR_62937_1 [Eumeta japonica]